MMLAAVAVITTTASVAVVAIATAVTAAVVAAAGVAALTTAVAAPATAVAVVMAASVFIGEPMRTVRNRDRDAVPAVEFKAGRARRGRKGNAFAFLELEPMPATRRWNRTAVAAVEFVAGRTFGAVLVVAGAATIPPAEASEAAEVGTPGQRHRAAGAEDQECGCDDRRQA